MKLSGWAKILAANLRHQFPAHLALAAGIVLVTPLLFSLSALNAREAAQPLEQLVSMTGMVLLTPVFLPEQNEAIRDVIRSKRVSYLAVCVLRVAYSALALGGLVALLVLGMKLGECDVGVAHIVDGFAVAFFLGAIGVALAKLGGSPIAGYMASLIYYLCNIGMKDKLGKFYLFAMSGGEQSNARFLLLGGTVLIAGTFLLSWAVERNK